MSHGQTFVPAAAFTNVHEAYLAKSVLEAAGIDAHLTDEHLVSMDWTYSNAIGGVKVFVPKDRLEEARSLLDTTAEALDPAPSDGPDGARDDTAGELCPRCGTGGVASSLRGGRVAIFSWLVIGVALGWPRRRRYCRQCGEPVAHRPA